MRLIVLLGLLPCFGFSQSSLSFGAKIDSETGVVYIIQQVVMVSGDSTSTKADAVKFASAESALKAVSGLREIVTRDSLLIVEMHRENSRHRAEITALERELKRWVSLKGNTESDPVKEEIARLRAENEQLRKQKEAGKKQ